MTRINLVPPAELYDQHLIAEYREIRSLTRGLRRCFNGKRGAAKDSLPPKFTLNKSHVRFFLDKGLYIHNRYNLILDEMKNRGFKPQFDTIDISVWPDGYFNDWEPSDVDYELIRNRIKEKVALKPHWYRYKGKYITGVVS
jgi:deoxyribonuclease (pyrimidine dimer)